MPKSCIQFVFLDFRNELIELLHHAPFEHVAEVSGPDDRLGRFGGADDDIYVGEALDHLIKGNCFAAKLGSLAP